MQKEMGTIFRNLRENAGYTIKYVIDRLKEYNIDISDKALYSYESNKRAISADTFLALCEIYNCKNILETFSNIELDYSIPAENEWKLIEKYRSLDSFGQETVNMILDRELKRTEEIQVLCRIQPERQGFRIIQYYQKLASAGTGQVVFGDVPVERIEIPDIPEYKRVSYAISVNGHSMEPLYHDGDMLLIEPTCEISVGEIGIFIVGNEAFVKKLGSAELISLNKGYDNIPLTEDSKCMGRVVGKL